MPKSVFLVQMGAENSGTVVTWGFTKLEDAQRLRDHLDSRKGASKTPSYISEHHIFDSFEEAFGLEK